MAWYDSSESAQNCKQYVLSSEYDDCVEDDTCMRTNSMYLECCVKHRYCRWYGNTGFFILMLFVVIICIIVSVAASVVCCCTSWRTGVGQDDPDREHFEDICEENTVSHEATKRSKIA